MPLSVFRLRNLRAANLVIFLLYAAIFGFWFFQSLYMQGTLHYSALETGLAFVPMTLAVGTGRDPRAAPRQAGSAPRWCSPPGCSPRPSGEALLTGVHPGGSYLGERPSRAACSAPSASGSRSCPRRSSPCRASPRALSGLASGVLNTSRFVGAALGLAVLSTLAATTRTSEIASGHLRRHGAHRRLPAPVRRRRRLLPGRRGRGGRPAAPAAGARARAGRPAPKAPSFERALGAEGFVLISRTNCWSCMVTSLSSAAMYCVSCMWVRTVNAGMGERNRAHNRPVTLHG